MENTNGKRYRDYRNAKLLRCSKCQCTYFTKVTYNQYRDEQTDLLNGQREVDSNYRAVLLQCLSCDKISVPSISYSYANGAELEIATEIDGILRQKYSSVAIKE
jgi:hypothetical protein